MFKKLGNMLSRDQVIMYVVIIVLFAVAYMYMNNGNSATSKYTPPPKRTPMSRRPRYTPRKARYQPNNKMPQAAAGGAPAAVSGVDITSIDQMYAPSNLEGTNIDLQTSCAANNGVGLASSLLPREAASQENFGEFAPDDVLKGQSFLNPRDQVGYPETVGGSLRNSNQQLRAEPPNPKKNYVWQNSTIPPDAMQRPICT